MNVARATTDGRGGMDVTEKESPFLEGQFHFEALKCEARTANPILFWKYAGRKSDDYRTRTTIS